MIFFFITLSLFWFLFSFYRMNKKSQVKETKKSWKNDSVAKDVSRIDKENNYFNTVIVRAMGNCLKGSSDDISLLPENATQEREYSSVSLIEQCIMNQFEHNMNFADKPSILSSQSRAIHSSLPCQLVPNQSKSLRRGDKPSNETNCFDTTFANWNFWWRGIVVVSWVQRMRHLYDWICYRRSDSVSSMPSHLSYELYRWLAGSKSLLSFMHGTCWCCAPSELWSGLASFRI